MPLLSLAFTGCVDGHSPSAGSTQAGAASAGAADAGSAGRGCGGYGEGRGSRTPARAFRPRRFLFARSIVRLETAMPDHVRIFDTTLRDGEQSPGISLDVAEKLEIAEQLARLGVDVIEAGFPIASQGDFESVEAIAKTVRGSTIAGLSRTGFKDVDRAWEAVRHAEQPRIHIF